MTIVVEAIDWRGSAEGKSGKSDPIVFLVTDRAGLLEAMDKLDALVKANPKMKDDPKYKKLRKHVEIELE